LDARAAVISGGNVAEASGLGLSGISFAFGLAVVAMAYTIGAYLAAILIRPVVLALRYLPRGKRYLNYGYFLQHQLPELLQHH
jgi:aquaporin Z